MTSDSSRTQTRHGGPAPGRQRGWLPVALLVAAAGCATPPERTPVPPEYTTIAQVRGISKARFWGDDVPWETLAGFENATDAELRERFSGIYAKPHEYLAISGGGANGAFGAGLLVGWTATGERPEFDLVTGVSTGALTAPFAFLGPEYDDELETVYTTTTTTQIARQRNPVAAAFGESIADTAPLATLIAEYFDAETIEAIAREYAKGRRLFVGTMNLDAGRPVIWDIGAIAASDHPEKIGLIHDVLRASASIPVAFPPVIISVEVGGENYDEMHVDGGTGAQVFVYPAALDWRIVTEKLNVPGRPRVYVIRNSFLDPDHRGIRRNVLPIASRTIDSLIRTQGIGDLFQIHALCERDGIDFNLAYVPADFVEEAAEPFDPVYMRKLFDRGYQMAVEGYDWSKAPPGFIIEDHS